MLAELIVAYVALCAIWVCLLIILAVIGAYATFIWVIIRTELRN
jgi:hypothetical protein